MIICGDCLIEMAKMEPNSIDAIVTDPPYGLSFMGKDWDYGIPGVHFWVEAIRVAKPGCHLLAFGGTRTFHRLACAIEDAGWEIRDCLMWVYGSGFPKSHDVGKAIDKAAGAEREQGEIKKYAGQGPEVYGSAPSSSRGWGVGNTNDGDFESARRETIPATDAAKQWDGWGTALKPAWEPIILARKPLDGTVAANVLTWGTGAINVDGCRVGTSKRKPASPCRTSGYVPGSEYQTIPRKDNTSGWNTNIGRWPANLIHDGSDEVMELFPQTGPGMFPPKRGDGQVFGKSYGADQPTHKTDSGSAARFFYCAKASRKEREMGCEGMDKHDSNYREEYRPTAIDSGDKGQDTPYAGVNRSGGVRNHHPTVKPLALMRYLCRLVTPPGGLILDPFMGSGTTLIAAGQEGFRAVGIEVSEEYCEIARKRIYGTLSMEEDR